MSVVPEAVPAVKTCKRCGETKPILSFKTNKTAPDGRCNKCRDCRTPRPPALGVKACRRCGIEKPMTQFMRADAYRDGRGHVCRDCKIERAPLEVGEKTCACCGETRPITHFKTDKDAPGGRIAKCRACKTPRPPTPTGEKTCKRCGLVKPLSAFNPDKNCRDGHLNSCKDCRRPKFDTFEERFWSKVDRSGGTDACWPWLAGLHAGGYGHVARSIDGAMAHYMSHRVAWELTNGPIPDGLCVCHRCDNPPCCNPAHLFLGTQSDNVRDMVSKGRNVPPDPKLVVRGERAGRAKLTDAKVREIRKLIGEGLTQRRIAEMFGVNSTSIWQVATRKSWAHVV